jgi:2-polyprenyl-6-methoxyphenol hydroxylase-like FAD-dependent oxidoreductase
METMEMSPHGEPPLQARCCIAGCGPAGAMLGLLLARRGIEVVVLEKHGDFLRDFRGDTIHPSTLALMHELGLADALLRLPHYIAPTLSVSFAGRAVTMADFRQLKTPWPYLTFLPQWDFLTLLTEQAKKSPTFHLLMNAEAQELLEEDGRVIGLRYQDQDGPHEVRGALTVAADGRTSRIRQQAGMQPIEQAPPLDVLWFRLSHKANDPGDTFFYVAAGQILLLIGRGDYWQCAYVIPKGRYPQVREAGLDEFKQHLAELLPNFIEHADELTSWEQIYLLSVQSNRLRRWYRPGLLCIGDAAHAMSPLGGVGINLALQDAVVAANVLTRPLQENRVRVQHLRAIQRKRAFPTALIQLIQAVAQKRLTAPVLRGERLPTIAAPLLAVLRLSGLRNLPACPPDCLWRLAGTCAGPLKTRRDSSWLSSQHSSAIHY